jgi:hypothetical protein
MGRLANMYLLGNAVTRDSASAYIWLVRAISAVGDLSDEDIGKWEEHHDDLRFWTEWRDEAHGQMTEAEKQLSQALLTPP